MRISVWRGAALIAWVLAIRTTGDLEFFATRAETVDLLGPELERAFCAEGLQVEVIRSTTGFVRVEIRDGDDTTELDLAWDYRMRALQRTEFGLTLARDELAADKVLALYGGPRRMTTSKSVADHERTTAALVPRAPEPRGATETLAP